MLLIITVAENNVSLAIRDGEFRRPRVVEGLFLRHSRAGRNPGDWTQIGVPG